MFREGPIRKILSGQIDFDDLGDIEREWKDVIYIRYSPVYHSALIHTKVGVEADQIENVKELRADADMEIEVYSDGYMELKPKKGKFKRVAYVAYRKKLYVSR